MKPSLTTLLAIVVSISILATPSVRADEGLVSSWTLMALERAGANGEPTRARAPRGLLVFDRAGYVFEYFSATSGDPEGQTDAQRAFDEHGGFWGRYEADAASGRIDFAARAGVSPSVRDLKFTRRYELAGDRLIVTSANEPQAQGDARWIWQRVPTVAHFTPAYRNVVGFWEHLEERRVETASGEILSATKRAPSLIVYTPGGFVGVHFPRMGREPFGSATPTAEEAEAALRGYIGYFGALSVYPGEVAHNVLGGLSPGPGSILRRAAAIEDDMLVVTLQNVGALISGEPASQVTTVHLRRLSDADDMLPSPPR